MNANNARTLELWTQAERARLMQHIAVLPCPRRVAESLDIASLLALVNAERDNLNGYRIRRSDWDTRAARELIAAGIVESGWGGIGTFGERVRKVALAMKRDGELG